MSTPKLTDAQVADLALPGESWTAARLRTERQARRAETQEALRAFGQLSKREQLQHWLKAQGQVEETRLPLDSPHFAGIVSAGQSWVRCAELLPEADKWASLRYMIYSPPYGGWIHRCWYAAGRWVLEDSICPLRGSPRDRLYIGRVTHWRLAGADEQSYQARRRELPRVIRHDSN